MGARPATDFTVSIISKVGPLPPFGSRSRLLLRLRAADPPRTRPLTAYPPPPQGRADNVKPCLALFKEAGVTPWFVVGAGEKKAYTAKGATKVVEGGRLCASRNKAIELAREEGKLCLECSDDLQRVKILHQVGSTNTRLLLRLVLVVTVVARGDFAPGDELAPPPAHCTREAHPQGSRRPRDTLQQADSTASFAAATNR
jgi:hypothetical protein